MNERRSHSVLFQGLIKKENNMAGKLNGNAKWIGIGLTIVLLIGNIIWQSSAISGAVDRHERRISRNEEIINRIDKSLVRIETKLDNIK